MSIEGRVREDFVGDTEYHQMAVVVDQGVVRHLKFASPGGLHDFTLTTWSGHLAIAGSMGCFVFARLEDMFEFFRGEGRSVNAPYWAEKLVAWGEEPRTFSGQQLRSAIREFYPDADDGLLDALEATGVFDSVSTNEACMILDAFEHEGQSFGDAYDLPMTEFAYRFLWCLHAIRWGIQEYDKVQMEVAA